MSVNSHNTRLDSSAKNMTCNVLARNVTVKRISDGCASSMVVDSLVPNVDFEPYDYREDAPHFQKVSQFLRELLL